MGKPVSEYELEAAWAALGGFPHTKGALRNALQAAHDAIEPTPDIVVTEEMLDAGNRGWCEALGVPPSSLEYARGNKENRALPAIYRAMRKLDPDFTRPTARSPEPERFKRTNAYGGSYFTKNTREHTRRRSTDGGKR